MDKARHPFKEKNKKPLVKICGNVFFENSLKVASYKPDYMGWIFVSSSPRKVRLSEIQKILERMKILYPHILHVAVLSFMEKEQLPEIILARIFHVIQYISNTPEEFIEIQNKFKASNIEFWPVLRVKERIGDMDLMKYKPKSFFVLDTYMENQLGGTGLKLDLNLVQDIELKYFLAGGLNAHNIKDVLVTSKASGVDLSSGVESGVPGIKDESKLKGLFDTIQSIDLESESNVRF